MADQIIDEKTVQGMLNRLADMKNHLMIARMDYDKLRASVIPAEVQKQLEDIDAEYKQTMTIIEDQIAKLEADAKLAVVTIGKTVTVEGLQAVLMPGKVSWDTGKLDGMAQLIKEIASCKKVGEPFAVIRQKAY